MIKCFCGEEVRPANDFLCHNCKFEILYHINENLRLDKINLIEFFEEIKKNGLGVVGKCPHCCGNYIYGGYDISHYGRESPCCQSCHEKIRDEEFEKEIEELEREGEFDEYPSEGEGKEIDPDADLAF